MPKPQWQTNQELALKVQAGDAKARERMILENLELARYASDRYSRHRELIKDLRQVALMALIRAVDTYDPRKGMASFSHYAAYRLSADLGRAFDCMTSTLTVGRNENLQKVTRKIPKLARQCEGGLTPEVVAQALDVDLAHAKDLLEAASIQTVRIDAYSEDRPYELPSCKPSVEDDLITLEEKKTRSNAVWGALGTLPDLEREVIVARAMAEEPETVMALSLRLGVSLKTVQDAEAKAKAQLRQILSVV